MGKVFVTSDHHFGHSNLLSFSGIDGRYFRGDLFSSVEEMDAEMIHRWNSVVSAGDKVYHLGDFSMSHRAVDISRYAKQLNGTKVLIRGNHDKAPIRAYVDVFKDIRATHLLETGRSGATHLLLSHVPVHPSSLRTGWINVHGHTHEKGSPEGPYLSVCVEMCEYVPVEFGELCSAASAVISGTP